MEFTFLFNQYFRKNQKTLATRRDSCYSTRVNKIRKFFGVGCDSLLAVKSATHGNKSFSVPWQTVAFAFLADSVKVRDQQ